MKNIGKNKLIPSETTAPWPASGRTMSAGTKVHLLSSFTIDLSAKDIQPVNEMQHAIAVNTIVLVHRTATGGQRAADVTLLMQDVIHFEAYGHITLQERLGNLRVPYQLVAVHAAIPITTTALIGDVGY